MFGVINVFKGVYDQMKIKQVGVIVMGRTKTVVPLQKREWLRLFRKLKGYTSHGFARECGLCHVTYIPVESGLTKSNNKCSLKTLNIISERFGIKVDLFYYRCDDDGKLVDRSSIDDIFVLFFSSGFGRIICTEEALRAVFSDELVEYILSQNLIDRYSI